MDPFGSFKIQRACFNASISSSLAFRRSSGSTSSVHAALSFSNSFTAPFSKPCSRLSLASVSPNSTFTFTKSFPVFVKDFSVLRMDARMVVFRCSNSLLASFSSFLVFSAAASKSSFTCCNMSNTPTALGRNTWPFICKNDSFFLFSFLYTAVNISNALVTAAEPSSASVTSFSCSALSSSLSAVALVNCSSNVANFPVKVRLAFRNSFRRASI
mmetsp:Transcript_30978/g.68019  ORF Transcript_30978/g.68019 Transcript_30978/m.68019 type:complete len:214 (-) Transcript_30978:1293-1934(-)